MTREESVLFDALAHLGAEPPWATDDADAPRAVAPAASYGVWTISPVPDPKTPRWKRKNPPRKPRSAPRKRNY